MFHYILQFKEIYILLQNIFKVRAFYRGMKYAHWIKVSVFAKEEESDTLILQKLASLFPFSIDKLLKKEIALGFFEKKICIFEVLLKKDKEMNAFIEFFLGSMNMEEKNILLSQLDSRLDEFLHFFIRIDKRDFIENNVISITDSGDCFHIKISVASFPKKRRTAKKVVESMIRNSMKRAV